MWLFRFILTNFSLNEIEKVAPKTKNVRVKKGWSLLLEKKKKIEELEKHGLKLNWTYNKLKKEQKRLAKIGAEEAINVFVFN